MITITVERKLLWRVRYAYEDDAWFFRRKSAMRYAWMCARVELHQWRRPVTMITNVGTSVSTPAEALPTLTEAEIRALRLAVIFGKPDEKHDTLESALAKLKAPEAPKPGFRGTNPQRHPWFTKEPKPRDPLPPGCNVVEASGLEDWDGMPGR